MEITKIICTLGPASNDARIIEDMAKKGMDFARINLSHGTYESHQEIIDNFNKVKDKYSLKLIADTKGPEIRVGKFKKGFVELKKGKEIILTNEDILGDEKRVSVTYKNLIKQISVGQKIYANNGMLVLRVKEKNNSEVTCKIVYGGRLTNNKGLNVPDIEIQSKFISKQDEEDLLFAIKNKVDFIASSFISSKQNVLEMREFLDKHNGENIKIISKIENKLGVKNIKEIIEVSDAIMVARGDLGVELPLEKLPFVQKQIIKQCVKSKKPSIVATEMLESMTESIRPTRAEVSDVANAVYESASATMLSGETAIGINPPNVVKTMSKILNETEKHLDKSKIIEFI